jgi:hypothetical protein
MGPCGGLWNRSCPRTVCGRRLGRGWWGGLYRARVVLRTMVGGDYLIFCLFYGQCTHATQPDGSRHLWKAYRLRVKRDYVTRETIRYSRERLRGYS